MTTYKIIIDTDPGIDDAMAILFALTHPDIELLGLTSVFGNVTSEIGTRNALVLGDLAGVDCPVAKGASVPLYQSPRPIAAFVHGEEGFGTVPPFTPLRHDDPRDAAAFICDQINADPGNITLCPVGPLTNLALALQSDPSIADKVKAVHVMGGSMEAGGNASPYAEANIWQDPHSADIVFKAGWPVTLVGLDVTQEVRCDASDFEKLAASAPKLGGFLNEAVQHYFDFHAKHEGFRGCYMHDVLAVISVIRPDLFSFDEAAFGVTLEGERIGETCPSTDNSRPIHRWAKTVETESVRNLFFGHMGNTG